MRKMRNPKEKWGSLVARWFLYFFCYSVIGWCYEVFLEVVIYRWGFSNRGFLFGPYCPVYGFGALIFLACLSGLKHRRMEWKLPLQAADGRRIAINVTPVVVFFGIAVIATVIELVTSYLMEWVTGEWMWDYRRFAFNFQGRIALNPSLRFGLGGMVFLYGIQPLLEKVTDRLGDKAVRMTALVLFCVMVVDLIGKVL